MQIRHSTNEFFSGNINFPKEYIPMNILVPIKYCQGGGGVTPLSSRPIRTHSWYCMGAAVWQCQEPWKPFGQRVERGLVKLTTDYMWQSSPSSSLLAYPLKNPLYRPGAIHHARWMAINIYSIKMFVFRDEIGYDAVTQNNLQRINHFLVLFLYSSHWMTVTSTAKAPNNDMMKYQTTDKEVADAAL